MIEAEYHHLIQCSSLVGRDRSQAGCRLWRTRTRRGVRQRGPTRDVVKRSRPITYPQNKHRSARGFRNRRSHVRFMPRAQVKQGIRADLKGFHVGGIPDGSRHFAGQALVRFMAIPSVSFTFTLCTPATLDIASVTCRTQ